MKDNIKNDIIAFFYDLQTKRDNSRVWYKSVFDHFVKNGSVDSRELKSLGEVFWGLIHDGVLMPSVTPMSQRFDFEHYTLTEYGLLLGRDLEQRNSPCDYQCFMARLKSIIEEPLDEVIESYVSEAIRAYDKGCWKASTVMLGCASERAMSNLMEQIGSSGISIEEKNLFKSFDELERRITPVLNDEGKRIFKHEIAPTFSSLRRSRNDSGHPSKFEITKDEIYSYLTLFPSFLRAISKIKDYLIRKK